MSFRGRTPTTRGLVLDLEPLTQFPGWALDDELKGALVEALSDSRVSSPITAEQWAAFVATVQDEGALRERLERAGFLDEATPAWRPTRAPLDARALWAGTSMLAARGAIPPLQGTRLRLETCDVFDFVLEVTDPDALHDFAVRLLVDLDVDGGVLDALLPERGRGLPRALRNLLAVRVLAHDVVSDLRRFPRWSAAPSPPSFDTPRTFLTIEVAAPFSIASEHLGRFFDSHA